MEKSSKISAPERKLRGIGAKKYLFNFDTSFFAFL